MITTPATTTPSASSTGYLDAAQLLLELWPNAKARPSLRWLRGMTAKRVIPVTRVGRLVFFEIERVRAALRRFEVACH